MGLIDRFVDKIATRIVSKRPEVYRPLVSSPIGITDRTTPRVDQARQAYRGALYRCLNIRADAIALGLTNLSVERNIGQLEYKAIEFEHPWVTLLMNPCPNMSPFEFWKWVSLTRDLTGRADLVIQRDSNDVPIAFYPVFQEFGTLTPEGNESGGVSKYIMMRNDSMKLEFETRDVVRIKHVSPFTPYEAPSLIAAAAYQIDIDLYMQIYRRDSLKDGGMNGVILTSEQEIGEQQAKDYGKRFKEKYMGQKSVKEVAIMGAGLKPSQANLNARDLEFVKGADLNLSEILLITGVLEGMISDDANRANATQSRLTFYQNTVQPECEMIAQQLNYSLNISFGADPSVLKVRIPDLIPTDHEFQLKKNTEYVKSGILTINDVLREDGREEDPNGDVRLVPTSVQSLDNIVNLKNKKGGDNATTP